MVSLDEYFATRAPWRLRRMYFRCRAGLARFRRRLRYRRMPVVGWGEGWRVLVFRCTRQGRPDRALHVLVPVRGDAFDWERLRLHVRGEPWPAFEHEPGVLTGTMRWAGHHIGVESEAHGTQRLPMDRLVPGEFRGGVDIGLVLVDVRPTGIPFGDGPGHALSGTP